MVTVTTTDSFWSAISECNKIMLSPLVTFQVEGSYTPWKNNLASLLSKILRSQPGKTSGQPRFLTKIRQILKSIHFSIIKYAYFSLFWILHCVSLFLMIIQPQNGTFQTFLTDHYKIYKVMGFGYFQVLLTPFGKTERVW